MYTLSQYQIIHQRGFHCSLPEETITCIRQLSEIVGAKTYSPTPIFPVKEPIKVEKKITNTQECIGLLNKLTFDNFDSISKQIFQLISTLHTDDLTKIGNVLFTIASTNTFYSDIYASLFAILYTQWEWFRLLFLSKFNSYLQSFKDIKTCDSTDYNAFCNMKLENDQRKAFTLFLTHLIHKKIVSNDQYIYILDTLYSLLDEYLPLETKRDSIIEIIEHLYILKPKDTTKIKLISNLDVKSYPGLSNKVIFRCMDIMDLKV